MTGRHPRGTTARLRPRVVAGAGIALLLAAGCGAATNELNPGREELKAASKPSLGQVVVDDEGRTVYLFVNDPPNPSVCYGACASVWPPLTTSAAPKVEDGLDAGKVTTLRRKDGLMQVVYAGHPLYYYQADGDPEDAYGNDIDQFGGEWYAVTPSGDKAEGHEEGGDSGGS